MSTISACPFTHTVERGPSVELDDEEWDCAMVRCGDCAAMGPVVDLSDYPDHASAELAAIEAWNNREVQSWIASQGQPK